MTQTSAKRPAQRGNTAHGGGKAKEAMKRVYEFADLTSYPLKQRLLIRTVDLAFYTLIRIIGRTTRFEVDGWGHWQGIERAGHVPIYTCWHNRILLATYFWRQRGIVVVTSQSFDGEYIARFIQRFGYGAARGSSTRGGVGALIEMIRVMRAGLPAGFTIDGPRGPRQVAKMGAVLLAKKTGQPILPFTVRSTRHVAVPSWDALQVPLPLARARVCIAAPIFVPADAPEALLQAKRDELQRALDELDSSPAFQRKQA